MINDKFFLFFSSLFLGFLLLDMWLNRGRIFICIFTFSFNLYRLNFSSFYRCMFLFFVDGVFLWTRKRLWFLGLGWLHLEVL
jgi:hypothetical protein